MAISKNKLYFITVTICFFGLIWLGIEYFYHGSITLCPIKNITGYPCPSCGSTRSIQALFKGDILQAILINPLGIISFLILIGILLLISIDFLFKKEYYYQTYRWIEGYLQSNKLFSSLLILLILINWIWNIKKGL